MCPVTTVPGSACNSLNLSLMEGSTIFAIALPALTKFANPLSFVLIPGLILIVVRYFLYQVAKFASCPCSSTNVSTACLATDHNIGTDAIAMGDIGAIVVG